LGPRQRAETLCVRPQRLGFRLGLRGPGMAPLQERDGAREDSEDEQDDRANQKRAQTAIGASLTLGLALARLTARGQKLALELVQLRVVHRRPVAGRGKTRPAEDCAGVAAERLPLLSALGQPAVQEPALSVL